jgi:regulation of enolase protein 1 (concanavalin A-like superfamily)
MRTGMDTSPRLHHLRSVLAVVLALLLVIPWVNDPTAASAAERGQERMFLDVAPSSPHARAIDEVARAGITLGCAPRRFCPDERLTRAQMASLIARALSLTPQGGVPFGDVSRTSPHAGNIAALASLGVVKGCDPQHYCPGRSVSRAQMASVIARGFGLTANGSHPGFRDVNGGVHEPAIRALADAGISLGCGDGRFCGEQPVSRAQFASLLHRTTENAVSGAARPDGRGNGSGGNNGKGPGSTTDPAPPTTPTEPEPSDPPAPSEPGPSDPPPAEPGPSNPPAPAEPAPPISGTVAGELSRVSIGTPTPSGRLTLDGDRYTLAGAGADIWGSSDAFEFARRQVTGDISVVTRITSQSNTHPWAKAGVMMRADDSAGSRHVALLQTPSNGVALQYRTTTSGATTHVPGPATLGPVWLRLDREAGTFTAYSSDDGVTWRRIGAVTLAVGATALVGLAVTSHVDGTLGTATFTDLRYSPVPANPNPSPVATPPRLLYSASDVARYTSSMTSPGPYHATGDAGHGGAFSPGDGARSLVLAREFLANPQASYWVQTQLPFSSGDPWPETMAYVRPMHAAWVYMTQPSHPDRDALRREVKALLLHHASHASHDFANATSYPIDFAGHAPSPIFNHAAWMARLMKARDMLGRDSFTATENAVLDRWFYNYANWSFNWLHTTAVGRYLPGRLDRDYSRVNRPANAHRRSYDGGPLIGDMAMTHSNRHSSVASAASLAANYLKFHGYVAPGAGKQTYSSLTVDQLLHHSRLYVEETIRFSVYPQGFQGDFERGDANYHNATAQQGWLYAGIVLNNLVEMAEFHAKRGDVSVWKHGTTAGYDGTAGVPVAGGFTQKNLHFFAWSMSRYVNNGWNRKNRGEPVALPHFYHDVIPAATVARFAPNDTFMRDAWRRSGSNFPAYPQSPQSQGRWHAHLSDGAKMIGLIEQAGGSSLPAG